MRPLIFTVTCCHDAAHQSRLMLNGGTISYGSSADECPRAPESRPIALGGIVVCRHCGAPVKMTVAEAFPHVQVEPFRELQFSIVSQGPEHVELLGPVLYHKG